MAKIVHTTPIYILDMHEKSASKTSDLSCESVKNSEYEVKIEYNNYVPQTHEESRREQDGARGYPASHNKNLF